MADELVGRSIQAIYSSDLGRARETAAIIAKRLELPVRTDVRLRERNLGVLEGHTMASFAEEHPADAHALQSGDPDYVLPGGESARQRSERNISFVDAISQAHAGRTILIVAHGGVLNSFFRRAVGLRLEVPRQFSLLNAAINTFTVADSKWRLVTWGDVSHLHDIPTLDDN
jgi:2,3-bisphosphoglycerate-dependent phosphoglycerate mutase